MELTACSPRLIVKGRAGSAPIRAAAHFYVMLPKCMIYRCLKTKIIFIVFGILISGCSTDPFPDFNIPVYPKNENLIKNINRPAKGIKSVAYFVKIQFPAMNVITYYDKELGKLGYKPYSEDGYGKHQWESFNHTSGYWEKTNEVPGRFRATWVDSDKQIRIILSMSYKYDGRDNEWRNNLFVHCTVSKFFDSRDLKPPQI